MPLGSTPLGSTPASASALLLVREVVGVAHMTDDTAELVHGPGGIRALRLTACMRKEGGEGALTCNNVGEGLCGEGSNDTTLPSPLLSSPLLAHLLPSFPPPPFNSAAESACCTSTLQVEGVDSTARAQGSRGASGCRGEGGGQVEGVDSTARAQGRRGASGCRRRKGGGERSRKFGGRQTYAVRRRRLGETQSGTSPHSLPNP